MNEVLAAHQRTVADRVLDEEERARRHLVVYLSGAHAYGFPSPDSDLDLKAIHIEPATALLGLSTPKLHATRLEVIEGVEIDYSTNELQPALAGILQGNGNYLERVLGALQLRTSPELESLRPIVARSLSKRAHRHYQGFASGQLREFQAATAPTAKKVLYVLRTTLTGTHLLRTGEMVTDLTELWTAYRYEHARSLVEAKRAGERVVLDDATRTHWIGEIRRAFDLLDEAYKSSPLPEEAPNRAELEDWLIAVRKRSLA